MFRPSIPTISSRTLSTIALPTIRCPHLLHLTSSPYSTSAQPTRTEALSLYRSLLRASRLFETYNYREYVRRRAKDAFKQHAAETDIQTIKELLSKGKKDLKVAERQGWINRQYATGEKTVVELEGRSH
ncbi:hypothetical protein HK097_000061 [Rhizophlyctis rosea]|uniref:Complex 1 LYR protein domain-containing protein n=1 Tax=Rhizophlyctis rosea TaxID=64517 RepID=A0AAD5SK23_9FUNG|nr:hypothetical protein HK097_000061 [Rhizophlyctis rosea]